MLSLNNAIMAMVVLSWSVFWMKAKVKAQTSCNI